MTKRKRRKISINQPFRLQLPKATMPIRNPMLKDNFNIFKNFNMIKAPSRSKVRKNKHLPYDMLTLKFPTLDPFGDFDKDKRINMLDCRPFNNKLHGVKPNKAQMARIRKLPIYVTPRRLLDDKLPNSSRNIYHISDKRAPKQVKQRVYSSLKAYPQLITSIEKKKPRAILYTPKGERGSGYAVESRYGSMEQGVEPGSGVAIVRASKGHRKTYGIEEKVETAKTTRHELEHVRQFKTQERNPKLRRKYWRGKYEHQIGEKQARAKEEKLETSRADINIKRIERLKQEGELSPEEEEYYDKRIKKYKEKQEKGKTKGFALLFKKKKKEEEEENTNE